MNKPQDYDTAQVIGNSKKLPPGGYVCKIRKAEERNNRKGNPMLVCALDIFDGEYKDFFMNKFQEKKQYAKHGEQAKYPNDGMLYLNVYDKDGNTSRGFKTFVEALIASGATPSWDDNFCDTITNKLVGVVFRRSEEEYEGRIYWACKPYNYTSVEKIQKGEFTVPDDVPLTPQNNDTEYDVPGYSSLSDDDVPF